MNSLDRVPEQHLWGPRDTWKSHFYQNNNAVFASETGYHGMTDVRSIRKFIPEAELNDRHGEAWLCHASQQFGETDGPSSYRNRLMEDQAWEFWGYLADDLTEFMKCSQIVQAEAMKSLIELFRRKKWTKTGVLWWNVIDCWPQFSDAVTDYYYIRKLAFYYIRNSQKPVCMILSGPEAWNIRLTVSNDTPLPASGHYRVTDPVSGDIFAEGKYSAEADSAREITGFKFRRDERRMLLIEWSNGDEVSFNHYLTGEPPYDFAQYLEWLKILDEKIYSRMGRNEW